MDVAIENASLINSERFVRANALFMSGFHFDGSAVLISFVLPEERNDPIDNPNEVCTRAPG